VTEVDPSLSRALNMAAECCVGLFTDHGVELWPAERPIDEADRTPLYVGIIGFTGDGVRGTLVLGAGQGPIDQSSPARFEGHERHWISELTNQLLGRIKTQMLTRGVTIHLALPVVLSVKHIAPVLRPSREPLAFEAPNGPVYVWLDLEFDSGHSLPAEPIAMEAGLKAGAAVMF
jgi:hypothetical protein